MKLDKYTPLNFFSIWSPRYHDNRVLLAAHKVGQHNKIVFTKAPSMGEEPYYVSGKVVRGYAKESNGSITCYSVPIEALEPLEINQRSLHEI